MSEQKHIATLKIEGIIENDDGTSTLSFYLDDEFVEWFKKDQGLKRFSHKRFSKFVNEAIKNSLKDKDFHHQELQARDLQNKKQTPFCPDQFHSSPIGGKI